MSLRFYLLHAPRRAVLLGALALVAITLPTVGRADIQQTRQRRQPGNRALRNLPPNGVEQTVQVNVGSRVDITLEAHGQTGKTIEFIIRDQPAHGTLTDQHMLTRNTASITYVQDPGDPAENDQFTYAVQAPGSVVSAATSVPIQIIPLPAHLVVSPTELDFGAVDLGGTSRAQMTIENRGGSPAAGQLLAPPPWVIEGSPEYKLGKGERQTFQLVFTPGFGKVFEDEVVLGNQAGQRVHLLGTGIGKATVLKTYATDANGNPIAAAAGSSSPGAQGAAEARAAADRGRPGGRAAGSTGSATAAEALPGPTPFAGGGAMAVGVPASVSRDPAILNEVGVEKVEARWSTAHGMKLAWKTPTPAPVTYRIELRYLSIDPDNKQLVIDWRSYLQVEYQTASGETAAILRNLPSGTRQTVRVVAVDSRGRAAAPSPMIQVELPATTDWFKITPLRVMLVALAICLGLLIRRKRETSQILRSIAESRAPVGSYS